MQIQPKHRQHAFNAVAHVIGAALAAWPRAIAVSTGTWSPETYARKLREAVEAKQLYKWPSKHIDDELFFQYADELGTSIKTQNGSVKLYYGCKDGLRNIDTKVQGAAAVEDQLSPTGHTLDASAISAAQLHAFLEVLANPNAITPAVSFTVTGLTPEQTAALEQSYPIGFVPVDGRPNTWQIIT